MSYPQTIREAARALRAGEVSAVDLLDRCNERADALDDRLGVYIERFSDSARAAAEAADRELASGIDRGLMHGIPVGVKDNILSEEAPTGFNSRVENPSWQRKEDATVVRRLRAAGAVITGKTTTMEMALGVPTESDPFPYPRNPWDDTRWAGGSSSGSANGVAVGMFYAGVGSDTGGSIRIPASYCGLTGLKPTYGRVPRDGVLPLGNSQDCVGPLARTAEDARIMLEIISGPSSLDTSAVEAEVGLSLADASEGLAGKIIGIDWTHIRGAHAHPEFPQAVEAMAAQLKELGAKVVEVSQPLYDEVDAASIITWNSEAYSYSRRNLERQWDNFGNVRAALAAGSVFSAADYIQAQKVREYAIGKVREVFTRVDFIIAPTVTDIAPSIKDFNAPKMYASVFTNYWSALGNPAINFPIGISSEGMPLGIQMVAPYWREAALVSAANVYQSATEWHRQRAPMVEDVLPSMEKVV